MNTIELKRNFHNLIDSIENENILIHFYEIIKSKTNSKAGQQWGCLNKNEQAELMKAFDESDNPDNLLDFDTIKNKHKKWL